MENLSWMARSSEGSDAVRESRTRIVTVTEGHGTGNDCSYCLLVWLHE